MSRDQRIKRPKTTRGMGELFRRKSGARHKHKNKRREKDRWKKEWEELCAL